MIDDVDRTASLVSKCRQELPVSAKRDLSHGSALNSQSQGPLLTSLSLLVYDASPMAFLPNWCLMGDVVSIILTAFISQEIV